LARNFLDGAAREKEFVADQFSAEFARNLSN
jgi:hypothetical protein